MAPEAGGEHTPNPGASLPGIGTRGEEGRTAVADCGSPVVVVAVAVVGLEYRSSATEWDIKTYTRENSDILNSFGILRIGKQDIAMSAIINPTSTAFNGKLITLNFFCQHRVGLDSNIRFKEGREKY